MIVRRHEETGLPSRFPLRTGEQIVKKSFYFISAVLILTTVAGCKNETRKVAAEAQPRAVQSAPIQQAAAQAASGERTGTVVESISTGGYTYVHVDTGTEKIWAAAPAFQVKVGDKVVIPPGMPMKNYYSKTLDRTFDLVYFVASITGAGSKPAGSQLPKGHPKVTAGDNSSPEVAEMNLSGIVKPKGGKTVAEIYNERANLSGKKIRVRGKVVKFNSGIMGKNWIHLKDGTGAEGASDLTLTTNAQTKVGDTILARGVVVTDKDYGYGYKYAVVIEDAEITVE
jgi:hypothetical protein